MYDWNHDVATYFEEEWPSKSRPDPANAPHSDWFSSLRERIFHRFVRG